MGAARIASELGVRYLLEGTVQCDRSRLRIATRLIDPSTDDRIWSERFEGSLDDVFAIQERIARSIVESLEVRLSEEEEQRIGDGSIEEVIAWRCLVQGRQEALRWRQDSIDRAVKLLREGVDLVGDSVRLHAALGMTYLQHREAAIDLGDEPLERAERCARKVFEIDRSAPAGAPAARLDPLRAWRHSGGGAYVSGALSRPSRTIPTPSACSPTAI